MAVEAEVMVRTAEEELLSGARGVVLRQVTQGLEFAFELAGIPYEIQNKYTVSLLPEGKQIGKGEMWKPTGDEIKALDKILIAQEESTTCTRICMSALGCSNRRPFKMHFHPPSGEADVFMVDRPFACGGYLCHPFVMTVYRGDGKSQRKPIGRVREDFDDYCGKCYACCCLCTCYANVDRMIDNAINPTFKTVYSVRANLCCCGRVNNICGPSCCQNDAIYDILDTNGNVVANIQQTYAPESKCCAAFCRWCGNYNNYLMDFPHGAELEDKILLLTSLIGLDYELFESSDSNN